MQDQFKFFESVNLKLVCSECGTQDMQDFEKDKKKQRLFTEAYTNKLRLI